jgi:hypothetical protein
VDGGREMKKMKQRVLPSHGVHTSRRGGELGEQKSSSRDKGELLSPLLLGKLSILIGLFKISLNFSEKNLLF